MSTPAPGANAFVATVLGGLADSDSIRITNVMTAMDGDAPDAMVAIEMTVEWLRIERYLEPGGYLRARMPMRSTITTRTVPR